MNNILVTGAAGDVGTRLRKLLKGIYLRIRWSDKHTPAHLAPDEEFIPADLANYSQVENILIGIDGIVHLGGFSVEGPWNAILDAKIIGCYNIFQAAYSAGVKRVVFASSNDAVGFYPREKKIGVDVTVRPDSRYGVSKAFGEALGAFYADKHGLRVTCLRIGNIADVPLDKRRLSIWLKPEDFV
jgi:uronate dehydrogenase